MVKDNVTGLIWEVKTDDGSIHDKNNIYNWDDAQDVFIADLNAANFGNSSEWRLPTVKELPFLINSGRYDPAIDTAAFPNAMSYTYWSSTTKAEDTRVAWNMDFFYGVFGYGYYYAMYVKAVRGGQSVHMVILNVLVYAAGTCNAIDGAQVRIGNTVEETDQAGLATFHDVHLGEHEIAIEALGYALYQTTIDLSELGKTVSVGYYLQPLCEGDFDADGDVDGSDLAVFAAGFGRTNCDKPDVLPCKGDFDIDGDVDGSDLAIFAADFGRTNCPACPSE